MGCDFVGRRVGVSAEGSRNVEMTKQRPESESWFT